MTASHKQMTNLDIAKVICALLIVTIHATPFNDQSRYLNFVLVNVVARGAVPVFFAISGYLFFGRLRYENGRIAPGKDNLEKLLRYCGRIALMYALWTVVYIVVVKIPMWYSTGWWGLHVVKDALVSVVFSGSHYHLWYLLATVYAVPVLFLALRIIPVKRFLYVAAVLWICECLCYSYSWAFVDGIPAIQYLLSRIPIAFDALFRAVPLLFVGAYVALSDKKPSGRSVVMLPRVGFVLCALEAAGLKELVPGSDKFSYLVFTPFFAWAILRKMVVIEQIGLPPRVSRVLRRISTVVYCIHPLVIAGLEYVGLSGGVLMWLCTVAISFTVSTGYALLAERINQKKVTDL